ncbi:MAG: zinc ABC transporter substrate-binding protein [Muribaculum sp.]|nr:zinc ABC transporter substrate-binding protein [Muribaculum sp.]
MIICALLALLFLWACNSGPVSTKPRIAVSIQPQRYMLERIAGKHCDVICLLPEGTASTEFDASVTHLMNIAGCNAYFMIGNIPLENAVIGNICNAYPTLKLYDNSKGLALIRSGVDSLPDRYTWNSVKNAKVISYNMYKALVEIDPANKGYYRRRMTKFIRELDVLDKELKAIVDSSQNRLILPAQPELSYFARDYGLMQIATLSSVGDTSTVAKVDVNLYSYRWPEAMRRVAESIASSVGK